MFDQLLLLKEGGQSIYFGEIEEESSTVIGYFENNGARSCGPQENPAEWLMEMTSQAYSEKERLDWADIWQHCDMRRQAKEQISQMKRLLTDARPEITSRHALSTVKQLERPTIRLF